jgi:hypothetical protein
MFVCRAGVSGRHQYNPGGPSQGPGGLMQSEDVGSMSEGEIKV